MSSLAVHGKVHNGDIFQKISLKKGPWTSEEDEILEAYVKKHGEGNWNAVQKHSGLARCGKSCRLRWSNHLKPNLKKGPFTAEEQSKVIELHAKLGNKWSRMALELPGRTDNEIKNFWNTRRRKRERVGLPLYPPGIKLQALTKGNQENLNGSSQQADASQADKFDIPEVKFKKYKLSQEHPSFTLPPIYDIRTSEQGSDSFHFPVMQPPKVLDDSDTLYNNSLGSTCISSTPPALIDHDNIVQPPMLLGDSHVLYNSLDSTLASSTPQELIDHDSDQFRSDCFSGGYACLSGTSSISGAMVSDLPPFPCVETHQSSSSCWGKPRPASPLPSFDEFFDTLIQYPPPPEQTQSEPPVSPRSSGLLESMFFPPKILEGSDASCMHSLEKGEPNPLEEENSNPRELTNPDALPDFGWLDNDTPYDKDQCDIDGTLFGILFHGCRQRYL